MADDFDLIIIGGGINGAAIARDAALRGLRTILLEKDDFGSGASSKTSKMAHGGVRYLEQFQFHLVRESLRERALLLKNAPHLVHPLSFFFPIYSNDVHPLWQINLGLYLYDFLGTRGALPKHRKLSAGAIAEYFPGIKTQDLRGGCDYCDAQMQDNRLVIENVLAAEAAGAVVVNHAEVTALIRSDGQIKGVEYKESASGHTKKIYGHSVVNATGAWSGGIARMEPDVSHCRVFPTKGVHLILPKFIGEAALLLHAPQDKRVFFVLPWGQYSMVGTTDTFYDGDPDKVSVEQEDIDYLLQALRFYFPDLHFDASSVISSFAGLRPLVDINGGGEPSDITREHVIHRSEGGLITLLGGKYTTHRRIAEEVVDSVLKTFSDKKRFRACSTQTLPLPGAAGPCTMQQVEQHLQQAGLDAALVQHLLGTYGTKSLEILKIIQRDPAEGQVICGKHPHVFAELSYAIEAEHAKTLDDWFCRRTSIAYTDCGGNDCREATLRHFAKYGL